ncbi:MAG: cyclic nucleotide-binding domain-containing protein [Proteobacteria bacterium]|nr:cyclic nucleotide-binding domain-containing protein [Pseudomonadota bacterium]
MGPTASDLRTIPLFHGFADDELVRVGALFEKVETGDAGATADKPLFDVGEPATDFYLLTAGEVILDRPDDDRFKLSPPALIGELGALTGLPRSTRATITPGSTVWALPARRIQAFFAEQQEMGVRFLVNLLTVVADKVHRDQGRLADMRQHLIHTQKELKHVRELVLEADETPISAPVHDIVDKVITTNRRVNYRVVPPGALASFVRLDQGIAPVADISRTHLTLQAPLPTPEEGTWITGVLNLNGPEIPISGRVFRNKGTHSTIELDMLIDEYAATFEGYLTRVQLLDILC